MSRSERAFVDQRLDDLDAATSAAHVAAARWRLPAPVLVRNGMNAIYRCGGSALRVSQPTAPAELSLELAALLDGLGIPVARPDRDEVQRVDELSVTAWEFIDATDVPVDWCSVGEVVARVHELVPAQLPAGLPLPSPASFPWWDFETLFRDLETVLDPPARDGLTAAIGRWREWSEFDDPVVCHGDVHTGNVMMSHRGPVLIDWDLLCLAPRGWDHAPLMTWHDPWGGDPAVYRALADGYGWSGYGDASADAFAELRLVAATLMRLRAGQADPAAMPEAQRRLEFWRGDPDPATWHAQ